MIARPEESIYRFLDTSGDGSGTQNAVGDYSVTPAEFYFQSDRDTELHRLIIHIEDTTGSAATDYGNIAGGLTNGYSIEVQDSSQNTVKILTNGVNIKTNGGIGRFCYDVDLKTWSAGNELLQARWTFAKAGHPVYLPKGYRFTITFNDDLTGLIEHYFMVQGYDK